MQQVPGASAALNLGYICISNFPSIYVTDQFEKAQLVTKHIKIRKSRISFIPWIRQQCSSSLDTMTSRLRHRRCKAANQSLAMLLLQQKQYNADKLCNVRCQNRHSESATHAQPFSSSATLNFDLLDPMSYPHQVSQGHSSHVQNLLTIVSLLFELSCRSIYRHTETRAT